MFSQEKYEEGKRQDLTRNKERRVGDQKNSCRQDETETGIPGQETGKW